MVYIKINNILYPAEIRGRAQDKDWNNRDSLAVTLEMTYDEAVTTFTDDMSWSHVYQDDSYTDENGNVITPSPIEYDNSEFEVLGDITIHRNGTVTVKMGKPTATELLAVLEEAIK